MSGSIFLTTDDTYWTPFELPVAASTLSLTGQVVRARINVALTSKVVTIAGQSVTLNLTAGWAWSTIPNQSLTVGTPFTLQLANYDPAGTESYSLDGSGDALPTGLSLDASTGAITGTPTTVQTRNVRFVATKTDTGPALTTLTLTGGGAGKAWTFGQPFRQGDVPSGQYVAAVGPTSFQAEIRNRWSDGSVKYAVLSGIGGTSAELHATTTAPSGSNVAEPSTTASVQFSSPATTVQLATARSNGAMVWTKATAHKVREILGPVMSEFHYYSPVSGDNHLAVWWFVRAYVGGAVEVETVVENGWLNVASPTEKSYTATVTVNGTQRFNGAVTHLHHTRWSRADWSGTDPAITPSHAHGYLRGSKLLPNYSTAQGLPSSATLNALSQPSTPFAQGDWPPGNSMGDAGTGGHLLENWDALYCISGDARAYNSSVNHSRAAGRYGFHYRDETTGRPPVYASYTGLCYGGGSRGIPDCGTGSSSMPTNGGGTPPEYYKSHARPMGYLSYLLTGRYSFRELVEFQSQVGYWAANASDTFESHRIANPSSGAFTPRGWGWALRAMAAAVVAVPDADSQATQYRTHLGKCLSWADSNYTGQNVLGMTTGYNNYNSLGGTGTGPWQEDYITCAVGFAVECAIDALSGSDKTRSQSFAAWRMNAITGRFGGGTTFCYRYGASYELKISDDVNAFSSPSYFNSVVYPTWAATFAANYGTNNCAASTVLQGSSGSDPSILSTSAFSYWGGASAALAYAVTLGASGAAAGWASLIAASNYSAAGFNNMAVWSVVPR